jgi:hypothetical protein
MTPVPLVVLALVNPGTPPQAGAFGTRTAADVRSVDPDANHHEGDGAYGRFDGDLDLGLGVGPNVAFNSDDLGLAVRGTAFWYSTVGLDLAYSETLTRAPDLERRLGVGIGLRPLFLIRWSQALETGPAIVDLALDSLTLGMGANFSTLPGRDFGSRTTFEMTLGGGVPLLGSAAGPWVELRAGLSLPSPQKGEMSMMAVLSWHVSCLTPVVRGD